jgi:hypothetical protein
MSAPTPDLSWAFDDDSTEAVHAPLAPKEHAPGPLDPEQRERRARLLRDVRTANSRPRRQLDALPARALTTGPKGEQGSPGTRANG